MSQSLKNCHTVQERWLDKAIVYLFPRLLIQGSPWSNIWEEKERKEFLLIARIFFPTVAILYAAHYFLYDTVLQLQPKQLWFTFRWSMVTISLLCLLFYLFPIRATKYYKLPALFACWAFCYYQAKVIVWYPEAPWLYAFAFTLIASVLLRSSVLTSTTYAALVMATQWPSLQQAGLPTVTIVSASVVTIIFVGILRSSYQSDIRYFLLNQSNIDSQRKNIEMNIEFTNRIKAFIPAEIALRLERYIQSSQMTILQAIDEVLRPREKEIACLFSDIRGFTQGSRDLQGFVNKGVIPDIKKCSDSIEAHGGIPRKVGDLVFAYFDDDVVHRNLIRAVAAGISIARLNEDLNSTLSAQKIRRYILITTGDAIVGNIGGLDSSIEITALGSPVNFLSRVDELTKSPQLMLILQPSDILLSEVAMTHLMEMNIRIESTKISLKSLGLSLRDFPKEETLYTIRATEANYDAIMGPYNYLEQNKPSTNRQEVDAA